MKGGSPLRIQSAVVFGQSVFDVGGDIDVNRGDLWRGLATVERTKQRAQFDQGNSLLKVLLHGIAFHNPVGVEASGQPEDSEIID